MQINEFLNLNIAQIAPSFSGFLLSLQLPEGDGESVLLDANGGLPGNFALSTGAPIAISPDNWSNDFTASSDAGAQEDVSYETEADSIETAQIGTDAHAESPGAGVTDGGARAVSAVSSAGTAASIFPNAAAQSAPAAAAATSAARPAQATRPGRSGNIDQQQSAKVFDQLTNELVITSVAIAPALVLPSLAAAETQQTDIASSSETNEDTPQAETARRPDGAQTVNARAEAPIEEPVAAPTDAAAAAAEKTLAAEPAATTEPEAETQAEASLAEQVLAPTPQETPEDVNAVQEEIASPEEDVSPPQVKRCRRKLSSRSITRRAFLR